MACQGFLQNVKIQFLAQDIRIWVQPGMTEIAPFLNIFPYTGFSLGFGRVGGLSPLLGGTFQNYVGGTEKFCGGLGGYRKISAALRAEKFCQAYFWLKMTIFLC